VVSDQRPDGGVEADVLSASPFFAAPGFFRAIRGVEISGGKGFFEVDFLRLKLSVSGTN
jgi:hypothetical protein